jgi:hypothetical protein
MTKYDKYDSLEALEIGQRDRIYIYVLEHTLRLNT